MKLWRDLEEGEEVKVGDREFWVGQDAVVSEVLAEDDLTYINRRTYLYQREVKL